MTANNRRHVITRILRYFPDIKWETAADIVDTAVFDGKALVRVLNSLVTHFQLSFLPNNLITLELYSVCIP